MNELQLTRLATGGGKLKGRFDDAAMFDAIAAVIDAKAKPLTGDDNRSAGERQAEALADVCGYVLDHAPSSVVPECGGHRPHVNVLVRLEDLENRARAAALDFGGVTLSPESLRMLCCDAAVVPVVLDGAGQPLDVGRATRTIPDGLRRAVAARDRGCAHPGCDRPVSWCECHHIVPWECGGETKLSNLAMLCRVHHRQIHSRSGSAGSATGCRSSSRRRGSTRSADHGEKPCRILPERISHRRGESPVMWGIRTGPRRRHFFGARAVRAFFLSCRPRLHLLGVALVVELEEAVEDLALGVGADRVAEVAAGGVEAVVEAVEEVVPAVGRDRGAVDGLVDAAELGDVLVGDGGVEDEVVGLREAGLAGEHDGAAVGVEAVAELCASRR